MGNKCCVYTLSSRPNISFPLQDLRGTVVKISKFLGKDLSAEKLDAITDHCTFDNMKKNPMTHPGGIVSSSESATKGDAPAFMRKGNQVHCEKILTKTLLFLSLARGFVC